MKATYKYIKTVIVLALLSVCSGTTFALTTNELTLVTDVSTLTTGDKVVLATEKNLFQGIAGANSGAAVVSTDINSWVQYQVATVAGGVTLYDAGAGQYIASPNADEFIYGSTGGTCTISDTFKMLMCNGRYLSQRGTGDCRMYSYYYGTSDAPICVFKVKEAAPVTLSSIAITQQPTKREYTVGDALNLGGIVVIASYSDASTAVVTTNCTFTPANGTTLSTAGTQTITATYEGKTATTTVTVNEPAPGPDPDPDPNVDEDLREVTFDFANKDYGIPTGTFNNTYDADFHIINEGAVSLFIGANNMSYIETYGSVHGLKMFKGTATWNISVPENYRITSIKYTGDYPENVWQNNKSMPDNTWTGEEVIVDFTQMGSPIISTITVKYKKVGSADPELTIEQPTYLVYLDADNATIPAPVSLSGATITYEAANATIAEFVKNDLNLNSIGETTVTATQTDDDVYAAGTAECTLRVVPGTVSVTVGDAGWATYAPSYNVYMTETDGASAYYIKSLSADNKAVTMTDLAGVISTKSATAPASMAEGTGIMVQAPAGTTVKFPVSVNDDQQPVAGNLLVGVTKDTDMDGVEGAYIFAQRDDKLGFYVCTGGTLKANKSYLQLDKPADAPQFILLFDDDWATVIDMLAPGTDAAVYDLMGRRVAAGYRGVAVRRGVKCVIK